jgi:hypothetical protein
MVSVVWLPMRRASPVEEQALNDARLAAELAARGAAEARLAEMRRTSRPEHALSGTDEAAFLESAAMRARAGVRLSCAQVCLFVP